jgi:hypothetical protein
LAISTIGLSQARVSAILPKDLEPVHPRHQGVQKDQIGVLLLPTNDFQRAVGGREALNP